jgi:hypothetical protein
MGITVLVLALTLSALLLDSLARGNLNPPGVSLVDVGQGDSMWLHACNDAIS